MTLEEVTERLREIGFSGPQRFLDAYIFWKLYPTSSYTKPCLTNDKLQLTLTLHALPIASAIHERMATFDIRGEYTKGHWAELKSYTHTWESAPVDTADVERRLLAAWEALRV